MCLLHRNHGINEVKLWGWELVFTIDFLPLKGIREDCRLVPIQSKDGQQNCNSSNNASHNSSQWKTTAAKRAPACRHTILFKPSILLITNIFVESTFSWVLSQSMEQCWNDQPPIIQRSVASKMVNIYQSVHKGNLGSRRFFDWVHKVYNLRNTIWWNISVIRRDTSKSSAWDMFDYTPRNQG